MDATTVQRLLELNRRFYTEHGPDFSATRERLQPGVKRILERLQGHETLLDIGCGNGELARYLSRHGQRGAYLGLDFSAPLLQEARREPLAFPADFQQVELTGLAAGTATRQGGSFEMVFAFALLHHIPGLELRERLVKYAAERLKPGGCFALSNWQFLADPTSKAKIQPWAEIGLSPQEVDPHDHLLDWKRGGRGLRYVHQFDEAELGNLARAGGYEIIETFYCDGKSRRSGLYQVWRKG